MACIGAKIGCLLCTCGHFFTDGGDMVDAVYNRMVGFQYFFDFFLIFLYICVKPVHAAADFVKLRACVCN